MAYRLVPVPRRNGLRRQRPDLFLPEGVPVVNPDVTAWEMHEELAKLPWWMYPLFVLVAPVVGLVTALRGTRAFLTEDLVVEDLPSTLRAELVADHPLTHALTARRDERLLEALGEIHTEHAGKASRVAVVYGAAHVPAIVSGLWGRYGYRAYEAEWLVVLHPR